MVQWGGLSRRLRVLTHPALMAVDGIGCPPVTREGAVLFLQLINARHEHASTVLASNKGFGEWGAVLGDEVMAAALIDKGIQQRLNTDPAGTPPASWWHD